MIRDESEKIKIVASRLQVTDNLNSSTMDESTFYRLAQAVYDRILTVLDDEDPDVVEGDMNAGVLKINFPSGKPYILNTQRPVCEMWLAAGKQAWHFRYDAGQWICPKTQDELYARLQALLNERTGLQISF